MERHIHIDYTDSQILLYIEIENRPDPSNMNYAIWIQKKDLHSPTNTYSQGYIFYRDIYFTTYKKCLYLHGMRLRLIRAKISGGYAPWRSAVI